LRRSPSRCNTTKTSLRHKPHLSNMSNFRSFALRQRQSSLNCKSQRQIVGIFVYKSGYAPLIAGQETKPLAARDSATQVYGFYKITASKVGSCLINAWIHCCGCVACPEQVGRIEVCIQKPPNNVQGKPSSLHWSMRKRAEYPSLSHCAFIANILMTREMAS
jgi:hypothetical protein